MQGCKRDTETTSLQVKGKKGARCFLAVAGGINTPAYLGSRSTFAGGKLGGVQVFSIYPMHALLAFRVLQPVVLHCTVVL